MKTGGRLSGVVAVLFAAGVAAIGPGCGLPVEPGNGQPAPRAVARGQTQSGPVDAVARVDLAIGAGAPPVDLTTPLQWTRDPFERAGEPRVPQTDAAPVVPVVEPVVRTILFSADRSAALVDGRIVKTGDRVGDGLVARIEPDAVIVQTATGERKRLLLRLGQARREKR